MSMGDVFAFFGALLALGIALPGMLLAWSLLFPAVIEKAQFRLSHTPWWCLWLGCAAMILSLVVISVLTRIPAGPSQMIGWLMSGLLLGVISFGASGLAAVMGERLRFKGAPLSTPGALVRGAVSLELAAIFPLVGWFVVIPLCALVSLGAAVFAILNWQPRQATPTVTTQHFALAVPYRPSTLPYQQPPSSLPITPQVQEPNHAGETYTS